MTILIDEDYMDNQLNEINLNQQVEELIKISINKLKINNNKKVCSVLNDVIIDVEENNEPTYRELRYGYPFPLHSKITKILCEDYKIIVSLGGQEIRKKQYEKLIETLEYYFQINNNFVSKNDFSEIIKNELEKKWRKYIYIDPYKFIGDSFIGLVIADAFKNKISTDVSILTHNENLKGNPFLQPNPIDYIKKSNESLCIMMPNFIDNQINDSYLIIKEVLRKKTDALMIIVGRNIIIRKIDNKISIHKLASDEHILWSENKEQMLSDALQIIGLNLKHENKAPRKTTLTLINPLTSKTARNFSSNLISELVNKIGGKLIVGYGDSNINNVKDDTNLHPNNISDLLQIIKNSDFVCTADTSVAHIANRLNKFCVVLYNSNNWDGHSILSSVHNSPLGFSSFKKNFIPLIYNPAKANFEQLAELVLAIKNIIEYSWDDISTNLAENIAKKYQNDSNTSENFDEINSTLINHLCKQFPAAKYLLEFYYDYYSRSTICLAEFKYRKLVEEIGPANKLSYIISGTS